MTRDKVEPVVKTESVAPNLGQHAPAGFRLTPRGVEHWIETETDGHWAFLCSPVEVTARTRSPDGDDWGLLLRITDADGAVKDWVMPGYLLADEGTECRRLLLAKGVDIAPGRRAQAALQAYFGLATPTSRVTTVERTGWFESAFVLPERTISNSKVADPIIYRRAAVDAQPHQAAGLLLNWQENVAKLAVGNSRLAFAISAAFVGPLLEPTGAESGGFHFRGPSSIGKTTALLLATSVWGGRHFPASWRATSNGLEGIAASRSDTLLVLDEIGQCSPREVGDVVYMLGNGVGKQRANRSGDPRPPKRFRTCFISSGEVSIADKMREDSRYGHTTGGQEVRVVDIPADAGQGHGSFEKLHDHPSAGALARHLNDACKLDYGHAGVAFLERLVADREGALVVVAAIQNKFIADHCPSSADGQVYRVAFRFGLVAAAGELAAQYGIVPWPEGEAKRAAATCFAAWIVERGGTEAHEAKTAVDAVRLFLEKFGPSRFQLLNVEGNPDEFVANVRERAGYRSRQNGNDVFHIYPGVWRQEVCRDHDPRRVAKILADRGMLNSGKDRLDRLKRVPGSKNPKRFYEINASIFEHGTDEELPAAERGGHDDTPAQHRSKPNPWKGLEDLT